MVIQAARFVWGVRKVVCVIRYSEWRFRQFGLCVIGMAGQKGIYKGRI